MIPPVFRKLDRKSQMWVISSYWEPLVFAGAYDSCTKTSKWADFGVRNLRNVTAQSVTRGEKKNKNQKNGILLLTLSGHTRLGMGKHDKLSDTRVGKNMFIKIVKMIVEGAFFYHCILEVIRYQTISTTHTFLEHPIFRDTL